MERSLLASNYLSSRQVAIGKRALGGPAALAIPALVLLLLVTVLPLTWLFAISILDPVPGFGNYIDLLSRAGFQRAFLRTLKMATIVTAVTLVFGYPYAYAMTIAGRKTWLVLTLLVLLPLWTSLMARSFAWVILLSDNGVINNGLDALGLGRLPLIRTEIGVTIGMAQLLLPFMVLPLYNSMIGVDRRLVLAAQSLGASRLTALRSVYLPLTLPGIVGGATIVFIMSLGFYVTPMLLGSPREAMIAPYIGVQVNRLLAFNMAGAGSFILAFAVAVILIFTARFLNSGNMIGGYGGETGGASARRLPWSLRLHCTVVGFILFLPVPVVILLAFAGRPSFEFPPSEYSLRYFVHFFTDPVWSGSLRNSLLIGVCSAALATAVGSAAAYGLTRSSSRWCQAIYALLLTPIVLPGIVGAIAAYVFFLRLNLSETFIGLVLAHSVLGLPFVLITVSSVLKTFDRRLEMAAASLGASVPETIRTVTLPLILPGVITGMVFAFVTSFDEIVYTLFLQGPDTRTLPVQMYLSVTAEVDPTIAAASTVVVLVTTVLFCSTYLLRRSR